MKPIQDPNLEKFKPLTPKPKPAPEQKIPEPRISPDGKWKIHPDGRKETNNHESGGC